MLHSIASLNTKNKTKLIILTDTDRTRSSATAKKQRVSCPHGGG